MMQPGGEGREVFAGVLPRFLARAELFKPTIMVPSFLRDVGFVYLPIRFSRPPRWARVEAYTPLGAASNNTPDRIEQEHSTSIGATREGTEDHYSERPFPASRSMNSTRSIHIAAGP